MGSLARFAAAGLFILVLSAAAIAQQPPGREPEHRAADQAHASGINRWFDAQAANFALRYRHTVTSEGVVASNEAQDSVTLRGRFKFDAAARLTLDAGLATGGSLTSGWNGTGLGTGTFSGAFSLKQLYVAASPVRGIDVEYGGLFAVRGETTEITNVDNDIYLTGERLDVKRPDIVWLDDVSVTLAYLGDSTTPGFFQRCHRLAEINYRQYLVGKKLNRRVNLSAEYDRYLGAGTIRPAVSTQLPELRVADLLRLEIYHRMGASPGNGFSLAAEKSMTSRLLLNVGVEDIDRDNPFPNGDRYLKGTRAHALATVRLTKDLSAALFFTRAFGTDFKIPNRSRLDVVIAYNALGPIRHALGLN